MPRPWTHAILIGLGALPVLSVAWAAWLGRLGANPIERVTHETGEWALRFLLATLAISPMVRRFGWRGLIPFRRTLGLFAFAYACLHLASYAVLDLAFDWKAIREDVIERPYITAGVGAFLCMLPLAITSTRGWIRRLGLRWFVIHRLVYLSANLAVLHYLWLDKVAYREPLIYLGILAILLGERLLQQLAPSG